MALTLRSNGTGGGIISAAWWNDYYNLLLGVMHDQTVTLNYRPAGANTNATLTLHGDASGPLFRGYDSDQTTNTSLLDHAGNLTLSGNLTIRGGKNVVYANNGLTGRFDAQNTAPSSPATGDLWLDTSTVL